MTIDDIVTRIKSNQIGVLRTDTIYGLVGLANDERVVQRIYGVKGRDDNKPLIILIADFNDLDKFGINLEESTNAFLRRYWPGKVSAVLPFYGSGFDYLTRNHEGLTFRMPDNQKLRSIIRQTGPIVAPSANPQGLSPASDIKCAKEYFDNKVDFYVDDGKVAGGKASTLIDLSSNEPIIIRRGDVSVSF